MIYRLISSTFHYPLVQKVKRFFRPLKQLIRGKHGIYKALGFIPKDIKVIFDIGAGDGDYAVTFAKSFPRATITCFEPNKISYEKLRRKTKDLKSRVTCINQALSNKKGMATLSFNPAIPDSGSLGGEGLESEEVPTEVLDSFMKILIL